MRSWPSDQTSSFYDDWLVRDFLAYMVSHYSWTYAIPGSGKTVDTGSGWFSVAKASLEAARNACRVGVTSQYYIYYWQEVLGYAFGS